MTTAVFVLSGPQRGGAEIALERVAAGLPDTVAGTVRRLPHWTRRLPEPVVTSLAPVLGSLARRLTCDADVVVSTLIRADAVASRSGRPWVCALQSDVVWHAEHTPRYRRRLYLATLRATLERAEIVVAPSHGAASALGTLGIDCTDVVIVPNAVDTFAPEPPPAVYDDQAALLWIGRFAPPKDPSLAIEVLRRSKHVHHLLFVGSGPLERELAAQAQRIPEPKRVEFAGWSAAPFEHASSRAVLLNTSHTETFGNVIAEALARNIPTVATPTSGAHMLRTFGGEQNVRIAATRDPEELAALADTACARGFTSLPVGALDPLSPTRVAKEWARILADVVVRHGGPLP